MQAFLTRLSQIVADPQRGDSCSRTIELFDLFRRRLYARHDIRPSKRPAVRDKEMVDSALAELRQLMLQFEVAATAADTKLIFAGIRHRIDMTRRALAAQISRDSFPDSNLRNVQHVENDWELISGMRQRALRDRGLVLNSLEAIQQSRRLLGNRPRRVNAFTA